MGATCLQDVELGALDAGSQAGNFGFDARVDLLNLESVHGRLVTNAAFFEVKIEPDACGGPCDLFPQPLLELLDVGHETLILALHERKIVPL